MSIPGSIEEVQAGRAPVGRPEFDGALRQAGGPASGRIRLAQGTASPGVALDLPWLAGGGRGTVERLAGGSLRIGGAIVTGAMLLPELRRSAEWAQTEAALQRFGLDPGSAADLLAARAYVWGRNMAPLRYWSVPASGPQLEQVATALMRLEQAAPTTLGAAERGDPIRRAMVDEAVASALDNQTIERSSAVDPALSTSSTRARALAAASAAGMQRWQAHHIIPFQVMANLPVGLQQAVVAAGWRMDSLDNVIALPADRLSFVSPPNLQRLPQHRGAHPNYDAEVASQLAPLALGYQAMTPAQISAELTRVRAFMVQRLLSGSYHPRLH
jgi:hypothetical protein